MHKLFMIKTPNNEMKHTLLTQHLELMFQKLSSSTFDGGKTTLNVLEKDIKKTATQLDNECDRILLPSSSHNSIKKRNVENKLPDTPSKLIPDKYDKAADIIIKKLKDRETCLTDRTNFGKTVSTAYSNHQTLPNSNRQSKTKIIADKKVNIENDKSPRVKLNIKAEYDKLKQSIQSLTKNVNNIVAIPKLNEVKKPKVIFKNETQKNAYIIRDFGVGQNSTDISKKNLELTQMYFEKKNKKKKKAMKEEMGKFYKDKFGENNLKYFKSNKIEEETYETLIEKKNRKNLMRIRQNAKNITDAIEKIDISYEEIKPANRISGNNFSIKNLKRVIKLRNIIKNKKDIEEDNVVVNDIQKFKEETHKSQGLIILALQTLGPPAFVKTRFNSSTIQKYKMMSGKYF